MGNRNAFRCSLHGSGICDGKVEVMKTPAKIELGIKCCASANVDKCTGCPYAGLPMGVGCKTILFRDVQDYLKEIRKSAARIEAMTKQLEATQPKWISVEERLPLEDETVIVCADDGCVYAAQYWGHGKWRRELIGCIRSDTDVTPTHWMPLPPPPKEET